MLPTIVAVLVVSLLIALVGRLFYAMRRAGASTSPAAAPAPTASRSDDGNLALSVAVASEIPTGTNGDGF